MLKLILSAAFALTTASLAIAEDNQTAAGKQLPIIIKNELVKPGTCRLSFEDGDSKEVPCTKKED